MRKIFVVFIVIIFLFIISISKSENVIGTFNYINNNSNNDIYFLDFSNDNLSTKNIKLKLGVFTGYNYKVNKIYPKKIINKGYYSYDFKNIDLDISNFTEEYIRDLKNNYSYNLIDDVKENGIVLVGIELYADKEAIEKFKIKYPNVKCESINNKK